MSVQPLFTPARMGDLDLPNRIIMAPLSRMRARRIDHVATALQAEYYAQHGLQRCVLHRGLEPGWRRAHCLVLQEAEAGDNKCG